MDKNSFGESMAWCFIYFIQFLSFSIFYLFLNLTKMIRLHIKGKKLARDKL